MVFPIVGGDGKPTGYEISNSLRWNDGDSPEFQFTPSSTGNQKTWTVSFWVKRSHITTTSSQFLFATDTGHDEHVWCRFCGTEVSGKEDMFQVYMSEPNGRETNVRTNRLFRDVSAWYHIVVRCDTTQSTAADRLRIYVNGVKETSFQQASYVNQNDDNMNWNDTVEHAIGHQVQSGSTERHLDAYLSEMYSIDGTSLGPDSFGETNSNGVWVPIEYDGSYGTNGWYLEFKETGTSANSSGMGADTSGNDHHWTPGNLAAIDQTTDTPTNNFATLNPVSNFHCGATYQEGNTRFVSDESKYGFNCSSIAVSSGKWYAEFKPISKDGESGNWYMVGIASGEQTGHRLVLGRDTGRSTSTRNGGIGWVGYGTNFIYQNDAYYDGDSNSYSTAAYTEDDILGVALNADDNQVTFYKNGTVQNSGTAFVLGTSETGLWHFGCGHFDTGNTFTIDANFGNPPYSNSSGNADANGYGDFEYAPPANYYALCTKNLAEYG